MKLSEIKEYASSKLIFTARIVGRSYSDLKAGEIFSIRFAISNCFSDNSDDAFCQGFYKNVLLSVGATPYAKVVGGNRTIVVARDLAYGESCSVDVRFEALMDRPKGFFFVGGNPLFNAEVKGEFDIVRYFTIRKSDLTFIPENANDEIES